MNPRPKHLALALLAATTVAVAQNKTTNNPQQLPINLKADSGEYDANAGIATYTGHVVVTQGEMNLKGDKIVIRLQDGSRDCVQALGNRFGELQRPPFIRLRGDDRTGAVSEGEWLDINGSQWAQISEVLVYAFIYEGVPNWDATDGVVTLHVQGQQIETRLTEGNPRYRMCAIARLLNENGSIRVERINRYFSDHRSMDKAFGWGFRWTPGRK